MEVGSEMSVLVLDVVGGGLHKRKLAVLSQHQVLFDMINASFAREVLLLELRKISFSSSNHHSAMEYRAVLSKSERIKSK